MANKKPSAPRPTPKVETPIVETVEAPAEELTEPTPVDVPVVFTETVYSVTAHTFVRAGAGDSYLTIAERYVSDPREAREYAKTIQQANNYSPVSYRMKVFLP